ncbi:MAG TPA: hypothetical protein QF564_14990 [Pirellulaceae bacterium]|nr:hypothetical protein [Pirellulaceae bacterium]
MGKVRDASKEQYWRGVIGRQVASGETVTRFCAGEGVSAHRFYWWRRALRSRDRQSTPDVQVSAADERARQDEEAAKSFVPVRLPFLTQVPIEMVHPGGWVVRVPAGFDPLSLRRILAMLDPCSSDVGEN